MAEYLVLVDEQDRQIGTEEKVRCHLPDGLLHRAFTALLFDEQGRLALTRRSADKMLWPGDWDGTFASHPRESETYVQSSERRMPEEIGIRCKMDYLFKFEYHVPYRDIGSENEICATLAGVVEPGTELRLVPSEISEYTWMSPADLLGELEKNPGAYCPWMLIALYLLPDSDKNQLQRYGPVLEKWITEGARDILTRSIRHHLADDRWRLVRA